MNEDEELMVNENLCIMAALVRVDLLRQIFDMPTLFDTQGDYQIFTSSIITDLLVHMTSQFTAVLSTETVNEVIKNNLPSSSLNAVLKYISKLNTFYPIVSSDINEPPIKLEVGLNSKNLEVTFSFDVPLEETKEFTTKDNGDIQFRLSVTITINDEGVKLTPIIQRIHSFNLIMDEEEVIEYSLSKNNYEKRVALLYILCHPVSSDLFNKVIFNILPFLQLFDVEMHFILIKILKESPFNNTNPLLLNEITRVHGLLLKNINRDKNNDNNTNKRLH